MRLLLPLLASLMVQAEIIDRTAISVANRVITESEILRQIRITAFLNGVEPVFTPVNKRTTGERLVEQTLVRRELEASRYVPSTSAWSALNEELKRRFKSPEEYEKELAKYGLTDADVRQALEWQAVLMDFVEIRFRPGVQIPESEIREYYDQRVAAHPGKLPSFEDARGDIETILTQQRVDNALDRWLGQARTQIQIRYTQEVFR